MFHKECTWHFQQRIFTYNDISLSAGLQDIVFQNNQDYLSAIDGKTFACPVCRAGKNLYKDIGPREKPSGFEENLTYGFGFNSLPPGQKNIFACRGRQ